MKMRNEYTCPLELTHDIIKGKWKPIILWELSKGGSSLSVLKKVHPGNQPENAGAASERASGMGNDRKNDK
ncbi:hypothetical protein HMPREF1011_01144 [Anaerostipes caccae]|nr:hypothetical protein [Anaerostipes caccae]EFV23021.1 hypothetical protein HMPREF1011_01144 [Anaerostipes caccae]